MSKKKDVVETKFPDNWSPNRVTQQTKPSDSSKTDTFYNNKGDDKAHKGHTVQTSDGKLDYARTMDGKVLIDKSKK